MVELTVPEPGTVEAVHVEPDLPSSEPSHRIRPGIETKSTLRLLVGFDLSSPPLFETDADPWTGARRELGYWMVSGLESIRRTWLFGFGEYRDRPPGFFRRAYRRVRRRVAAVFLLPSYRLPSQQHSIREWEVDDPGFEASRRIFDLRDKQTSLKIVCHVFAQRHGAVTDRLLEDFAGGFTRGLDESRICDVESHLHLLGRSSLRLPRRQYWEIVIGPLDLLLEDPGLNPTVSPEPLTLKPDIGPIDKNREEQGSTLASVEPHLTADHVFGSALPRVDILREINERSVVDWKFMTDRIDAAIAEGADLDDEFVERLAQERFLHAKEVLAGERPGPTIDSSRRIVREVVDIHRLGHESDSER